MTAFLAFMVGLLLGILVTATVSGWVICNPIEDMVNVTREAKETLESLEEALEEGYVTINELPKE